MIIGVFFEFAALTSGVGMLVGGFFGMNTKSGLEESSFAWGFTVLLTILLMAFIMGCFMRVILLIDSNLFKSLFYYFISLCFIMYRYAIKEYTTSYHLIQLNVFAVFLSIESRHQYCPEIQYPQELLHILRRTRAFLWEKKRWVIQKKT